MVRALKKRPVTGRIELTDRDKTLIRAAYQFRFFTTDQAQLMTGTRGRSALNTRLAALYDHGYLDRPEIQ